MNGIHEVTGSIPVWSTIFLRYIPVTWVTDYSDPLRQDRSLALGLWTSGARKRRRREEAILPGVQTEDARPADRQGRRQCAAAVRGGMAKAGKLAGAELTELLEREGLLLAEYEQWRLALAEEGRASLAITKRMRMLERELARKEKALAEAAALLVLKKK